MVYLTCKYRSPLIDVVGWVIFDALLGIIAFWLENFVFSGIFFCESISKILRDLIDYPRHSNNRSTAVIVFEFEGGVSMDWRVRLVDEFVIQKAILTLNSLDGFFCRYI
ncbi:hypothetical protein [Secundilactobacillus kimchicus]|uniref:hypothetical protein n=1 Tax=Secundilactobacillus kimchicus TaxID=528209 RepID=UPI0024A7E701|nr:hypothetical protein [Secundilactobacillus kimchicus]